MSAKRLVTAVAIVLVAASAAMAQAGPKPELVLELSAEKEVIVVDKDGTKRTEWQGVDETDPGDVLRYTISYTNRGDTDAVSAEIVDPVPRGTSYIGGSALGENAEITFSLDGKEFRTPPMLRYRVRLDDGTEAEYRATPEMYTHIKWKLKKPVPPGGSGLLSFKVRVK